MQISKEGSIWALWMHDAKRIFFFFFFWVIQEKASCSYTWKIILRMRKLCNGLIARKIENGNDSSMWFDLWINGESSINMLGC